jgi:hypothetical protein
MLFNLSLVPQICANEPAKLISVYIESHDLRNGIPVRIQEVLDSNLNSETD